MTLEPNFPGFDGYGVRIDCGRGTPGNGGVGT